MRDEAITDVNSARVSAAGGPCSTVAERADPVDSLTDEVPPLRRVIACHLDGVRATLEPRVIRRRDVRAAGHCNSATVKHQTLNLKLLYLLAPLRGRTFTSV